MAKNTVRNVILSIFLVIVLVSIVSVGTSLFFDSPEYEDFCDVSIRTIAEPGEKFDSFAFDECNDEYQEARDDFDQMRFFIFAGFGFLFILVGLIITSVVSIPILQITSLASGTILVGIGTVMNLDNKLAVFVTLVLLFIAGIIVTVSVLRKD